MIQSINPVTNQVINTYSLDSSQSIEEKLSAASKTYEMWRKTSFKERGTRFKEAAKVLRDNKTEYATLITQEMGMPISLALWEIEFCANYCDFYAKKGPEWLKDEIVETDDQKSYIKYQPLGPLLAIMPWNFPFAQVFRFAVTAIMAGNVVVLKHASNVPGCALAIEDIFLKGGFPPGVMQTLFIESKLVSNIIQDPRIQGVTVTGSEKVGAIVASQAGLNLKKTVLELGGSDPFIVLDDVDVDKVAKEAAVGRTRNSGQSCIAPKRFLIHSNIYEDFLERFKMYMNDIKVGDPMDPETEMGPLARLDLREELHKQVKESLDKGATCILGGKIESDREGAYYPPTILTDVKPGMPAYDDELFGPVASVIKFNNDEEAISIANATRYGLGASIWTKDIKRAENIASQIESGMVGINQRISTDLRLPFGGIKQSGYGREGAKEGIREFVNVKTVRIK